MADAIVKPLYQIIAELQNGLYSKNAAVADRSRADLEYVAKEFLPYGSGFDSGTTVRTFMVRPKEEKIVLETSFHPMDENGYYNAWLMFSVFIYPSWDGFRMNVTGKNDRLDTKEYVAETIHHALSRPIAKKWHDGNFSYRAHEESSK